MTSPLDVPDGPGVGASLGVPVAVAWLEDRPGLRLLDQTLLPGEERYLDLEHEEAVAEAIRSLRVRGAPAIGVAAAMGLVVGLVRAAASAGGGADSAAYDRIETLLGATRPTGRNLSWALRRMRAAWERPGVDTTDGPRPPPPWATTPALRTLFGEAEAIRREDAALCERIGRAGVEVIPEEGAAVLTHCNAGALATAGIGTALAPLYLAHEAGVPLRVWSCETRPLLQGARLTAWELARAGVDVTVVADSMAGSLMASGEVDLVIVGADAVAANGDVVNKIGTYGLAVLARHHGIPFYVAAPRSTFDPTLASGRDVPIEERDGAEVAEIAGTRVAADRARTRNLAFDVTPEHFVTALVTDRGILRPPYGAAIGELLEEGP